jgi:adenine-specific DNA-methyltransferase
MILISEKLISKQNQITIPITMEIQNQTKKNQTKHDFVFQPMLTCIGNKRRLLHNVTHIMQDIQTILNKEKLNIVDGFAGSSVVSRELSYFADNLYTNDLELYSYMMAYSCLVKPTLEQTTKIKNHINQMNQIAINGPYIEGIISRLYAPQNTNDIQPGERCFYTRENALIIDTLRHYIDNNVEQELMHYCLVPLLNKASIHTNTSGVFKGFHKNGGIGCFGGKKNTDVSRITKQIEVYMPIWNNESYTPHISQQDINLLIEELPNNIDIVYLDPPYNQHPYGSNYFMLNVIATNKEPAQISNVSGIPVDWNKSNYNYRQKAIKSMEHLLATALHKSKYVLLSYNNEGIILTEDWDRILHHYNVKKHEIQYDAYRGSRNLKSRNNKVVEIMYLISL